MAACDRLTGIFHGLADVPEKYRIAVPLVIDKYLVDGEMRPWTGPMLDVVSPICTSQVDGKWVPTVIGRVPALTGKDSVEAMNAAVAAYANGQGPWPTMSTARRIEIVQRFTTLLVQRRQEIVNLLMWEIGKNRGDSEKEFDRTMVYIKDTIDALKDLDRASSRYQIAEGIAAQIRRAPLGVTLCMGPFNYCFNETFTTLLPALIMGNTVIVKPPKLGVLLFGPVMECFQKTFPRGVVDFIFGDGGAIITPIMETGKVDVLAFIGTSRVADIIRRNHPRPHRLRCILGLDAKNPAIILPSADVDLAVHECLLGALSFNGQRCTAVKIIFVHRDIADQFVEKISAAVNALKPGLPWDEGTNITPMAEQNKNKWLNGYVEDAVKLGARVANAAGGGGQMCGTLFFPAVLYPVTPQMKVFSEEQFGPIIPIVPFDNVEVPIQFIRESNFGQQLSIFGTEPESLAHMIDPLVNQVCRLNINCQCQRGPDIFPFSGRKDSGEMTLSVTDALRCFSIRTLVASKLNPLNERLLTSITHDHLSQFLSVDFLF